MIIDLLLFRRQRGVAHFKFQCLDHILSAVKPEYQVITGGQTFLNSVRLAVQLRQFIGILLVVFLIKIFLQNGDLLIQ